MYFITGNKNKFAEVKLILTDVEQLDIELPEIQELDPRKIIEAKLQVAFQHTEGEFIVEDTSLYFDGLNGLPGPLIKWFSQALGNDGLANLAQKLENNKAVAKTIIGYAKSPKEIHFFEGEVLGKIVPVTSESAFGWDPIFMPAGYEKTFAEMTTAEKNEISMRQMAVNKLKEYLDGK
jgi:inosine triphosphate pyrophosphatase